jgi:hypothetical protein
MASYGHDRPGRLSAQAEERFLAQAQVKAWARGSARAHVRRGPIFQLGHRGRCKWAAQAAAAALGRQEKCAGAAGPPHHDGCGEPRRARE